MTVSRSKKKESTSRGKGPSASIMPVEGIEPYIAKVGEKYMNKKQLDHFRKMLNAWKQELENEITRTVHNMRDEPENPPDPNDRASQETDMSLELRSRDRERKLIKNQRSHRSHQHRRIRLLRQLRCRDRHRAPRGPSDCRDVHRLQDRRRNPRKTDGLRSRHQPAPT